jgi:hypothetical protein
MANCPKKGALIVLPPGLWNVHNSAASPDIRLLLQPAGGVVPLAVEKLSLIIMVCAVDKIIQLKKYEIRKSNRLVTV